MLEGFTKIPVLSGSSFMSVTNNGINFNGNVVFHLQRTKFVVFFLNSNEKQIAIQKCDESDEDKAPFFSRRSKLEEQRTRQQQRIATNNFSNDELGFGKL